MSAFAYAAASAKNTWAENKPLAGCTEYWQIHEYFMTVWWGRRAVNSPLSKLYCTWRNEINRNLKQPILAF